MTDKKLEPYIYWYEDREGNQQGCLMSHKMVEMAKREWGDTERRVDCMPKSQFKGHIHNEDWQG